LLKSDSKTKKENRKLKFTGFYKVTQVIKQKSHDLNVEITNFNNLNEKKVVLN